MLVLAQLLDWATIESERGSGGLNNAFDYPLTGGIAWVLTVLAGVIAFLLAGGFIRPGGAPWPVLLLGATGAATILMLVRLVLGAGEIVRPGITFDLQRGPGMWVAFAVRRRGVCRGGAEPTERRYRERSAAAISSPASVGLSPTATPAAARASIFPCAVPLPPETMAPAWPILRPAGAVTPAM